jgi:hypothetical protein
MNLKESEIGAVVPVIWDPDDGATMLLRNVGKELSEYT